MKQSTQNMITSSLKHNNKVLDKKKGKIVVNPEKQYIIVKQHFQKQCYDASKINI